MADRKVIRQQLLTAIQISYGSFAQLYSNHLPTDPQGQSPIVATEVASGEYTLRASSSGGIKADQSINFSLHHMVLAKYGATWTREMADDAIDDMYALLLTFLANNQETSYWQSIYQESASAISDDVNIGGELYIIETIPLTVEAK